VETPLTPALSIARLAESAEAVSNQATHQESQTVMTRLTVLYGHPTDPAAFDRYYHEVHIPIAKRMQGLKGWTIGKCQSAVPGEKPAFYMIVGLYAESRAAMEAILDSPEGRAAVADVPNFATGGATFLYDDETVMVPFSLA
jgi:uncharacterized protein (TIGR02118 family)